MKKTILLTLSATCIMLGAMNTPVIAGSGHDDDHGGVSFSNADIDNMVQQANESGGTVVLDIEDLRAMNADPDITSAIIEGEGDENDKVFKYENKSLNDRVEKPKKTFNNIDYPY